MFLGLDAERPFKVCSSIRRVAIKDTSITDYGAFNLMIHSDNLETLEYSQDTFLQQLLWLLLAVSQLLQLSTLAVAMALSITPRATLAAHKMLQMLAVMISSMTV